jgi:hypothetical protein
VGIKDGRVANQRRIRAAKEIDAGCIVAWAIDLHTHYDALNWDPTPPCPAGSAHVRHIGRRLRFAPRPEDRDLNSA